MWPFAVVVNWESVLLFPSFGFLFTSFLFAFLSFFIVLNLFPSFNFYLSCPLSYLYFSSLILLCTYYRPSIIPIFPYICRPWRVQLSCLLVQPLTYIQLLINCVLSHLWLRYSYITSYIEILSKPARVSIMTLLFKAASSTLVLPSTVAF